MAGPMQCHYPTPAEIGIRVPVGLRAALYNAGFRHALAGGQLDRIEYLRCSFRMGFRSGKMYLKQLRRERGIIEFPQRWRVRIRARWDEGIHPRGRRGM